MSLQQCEHLLLCDYEAHHDGPCSHQRNLSDRDATITQLRVEVEQLRSVLAGDEEQLKIVVDQNASMRDLLVVTHQADEIRLQEAEARAERAEGRGYECRVCGFASNNPSGCPNGLASEGHELQVVTWHDRAMSVVGKVVELTNALAAKTAECERAEQERDVSDHQRVVAEAAIIHLEQQLHTATEALNDTCATKAAMVIGLQERLVAKTTECERLNIEADRLSDIIDRNARQLQTAIEALEKERAVADDLAVSYGVGGDSEWVKAGYRQVVRLCDRILATLRSDGRTR